jgi:hypothetical protein
MTGQFGNHGIEKTDIIMIRYEPGLTPVSICPSAAMLADVYGPEPNVPENRKEKSPYPPIPLPLCQVREVSSKVQGNWRARYLPRAVKPPSTTRLRLNDRPLPGMLYNPNQNCREDADADPNLSRGQ